MARTFDSIPADLQEFIERQPMFFVATAPTSAEGRVNVSPKGYDTFRILSPNRVAYLDLTGSGNETSAHIHENGRVTFMFCSFDRAPRIVRLYGKGRTVLPDSEEWRAMRPLFQDFAGIRQIIVAEIDRVGSSCGYSVPRMELVEERPTLQRAHEAKGEAVLAEARREQNAESIDGLPTPLGEMLR